MVRIQRVCAPFTASLSCGRCTLRQPMSPNHIKPLSGSGGQLHLRNVGVSTRATDGEAALTVKAPEEVGGTAAVYKAVAIACFGAFLFGYHLGVVNGPLGQIASDLNFGGNVVLQGLVVSICLAGAAVGSLSGSVLADLLGRVKTFFCAAAPLIIGSALCATAGDATGMLAGRFACGVGLGLASAAVPLYISEVAPTSMRGTLGSVNQLMICLGILGALIVNVVLPAESWRNMFWVSSIPAVALIIGMFSSPETPAYLLSQNKRSDAETSAESLWGKHFKKELYGDEASAETDASQLEGGTATEQVKEAASGLFQGVNGKLVIIACSLFVFQQLSGINAIVYFSSSVFRDAGVGSETLASAAVGVVNVIGTVVAASLMDKRGRKQLLTISLFGQGFCMLVMAIFLGTPALSSYTGIVALVFTLLYIVMFALGTGPVPGLLCAELLPTSIRGMLSPGQPGRGVSIALGVHWVCNFGLGQLFLPAVNQFGVSGVYCFFAVSCIVGVFVLNKVLVETKGRSSDEIIKLMQ